MITPVDSEIKKEFYDNFSSDNIKLNWNKNPIEMKLFLSFLEVPVTRISDHLGSSTGWTLLKNEEKNLEIGGALYDGKEYLDSVQYGNKLSNAYNNYVSPFYIFEILNKAGRAFFVEYYKSEIDNLLSEQKDHIKHLKNKIVYEKEILSKMIVEIESIKL